MQQKIKLRVLDKLIEKKITGAEINFILYISHFQDDYGNVLGVYYKDVCEAISISAQTFYESLKSLEKKDLISVIKDCYGDWNIKLLDNDFSYKTAFKEGYINTGHNIFSSKSFYNMKANEKLMAMYILKVTGSGGRSFHIGVDKLFNKFKDLFGVTRRIIQRYLTTLRTCFSIGITDKNYWITPLNKVFKTESSPADIELYASHVAKTICRRNRINYTNDDFKDTSLLIKQYAKDYRHKITEAFIAAVEKSLLIKNQGIRNPYRWNRVLQPSFIHKLLIEEMNK